MTNRDQEKQMKMPMHIEIISNIPSYTANLRKHSKKQIQEIMRKYHYDEDFIETIDDAFCQGFSVARDIIIEMLETKYWEQNDNKEKAEENAI